MKKNVSEVTFEALNKAIKDAAEKAVAESLKRGLSVSYIENGAIIRESPCGLKKVIGRL